KYTASSQFLQQFSIIHVTDKNKRTKLAEICNQPPVSENGELFIFLIDLQLNVKLRQEANLDDGRLHTMDLYLQGLSDATLAVQNMYLAAESLGLGGVILGSIRNDIRAVSELFNLPDMVIPALGLQIGIPDEEKEVEHYYLSRTSKPRKENFTQQIIGKNSNLNRKVTKRDEVLELTHSKGMLWN